MDDFRQLPAYDNHQFVIAISDARSGMQGFIGIHSTALGPALGGTRFIQYDSQQAALGDALDLSRAMSFKCALANLPYGGGKGVLILNDPERRQEQLAAYARLVDKLGGLFKTGTDVGVTDDEVKIMGQYTSHMLGLTEADRGDLTTAKCAALGVFCSMKACLTKLCGSADFNGKRIAIKGVGKLGGELARLTSQAGAQVVVADVDPTAIQKLQQIVPGTAVVSVDEIHSQPVDIYAPCALGHEFDEQHINQLQCRAVVGGANNQLADAQSGEQLHQRQILYAPDYIANAGGLIYVADELEADGFQASRVIQRTEAIEQTMLSIFETAEQQQRPTYVVADELARAKIQGHDHD